MTTTSTEGIKTVLHPVTDLAAAKALYTALLGTAPQVDSSYYIGFDTAGQHIGLVPDGGPQALTSPVSYWHVPDIEAKLAEVAAAGAAVHEPAHDVGGGRLVATVTDPDGNVLGLIQDREATHSQAEKEEIMSKAAPSNAPSEHNGTTTAPASIENVTLEVSDPASAMAFYDTAFDLGDLIRVRPATSPTSGFRGFTLSLVVSQPANVDALIGAALGAGATALKPVAKSFWGYGGVVQAPDGTIWKVATSNKKNSHPASREVDQIVLLLAATDVAASKQFYVDQGMTVSRSFARTYVEFASEDSQIKLALYKRRALAKDAGVSPDGSGSHRIVIHSNAGPFTDPDMFAWQGL